MSTKNVELFYAELGNNPELQKRALRLQAEFERQEEIIEAFLLLARESGFPFTEADFITYIYENGEEEKTAHP